MQSDSALSVAREQTFIERARRAQIVAGAIEVLATSGYAGASLATIARHIGISKGVISYHFAGKDELLRAVVADVISQAEQYMNPQLQAAASAREALARYISSNVDFLDTHRTQVFALGEVLANIRGTPSPYAALHATAVAQLEHLLRAGQASGEFRKASTYVVATSLRGAIDAVSVLLRSDPSMDARTYAADLVELFDRAVRA